MGLLAILRGRSSGAKLPPPAFRTARKTFISGDDEPPQYPASLADVSGRALQIGYANAQGYPSNRRITIYTMKKQRQLIYMLAHCHECRDIRSFRSDRISEIFDPETGEVIDDHVGITRFLSGLMAVSSPHNATDAVMSRYRHQILALLFLARCDGHRHPRETDVILKFIARRKTARFDRRLARRRLAGLYPDERVYRHALQALSRKPDDLYDLAGAAIDLVEADDRIVPAEKEFIGQLADWLECADATARR